MTPDDDAPASPEPPSNPRLSAAMRAAAESGDPADRAAILAALAESALIVPVREGAGQEPEIRAARSPGGEPLLIAFTDEGALRAWARGPVRWAAITGPELGAFAAANDAAALAVNPAGPDGGELSRAEIARLAELTALEPQEHDEAAGVTRLAVRQGAGIGLRALEEPPDGLAGAIAAAVAQRSEIERAYLVESVGPGGTHPVVAIALAPGADPAEAARRLAPAITGAGAEVDLLPLDEELEAKVRELTEPLRP